SMTLRLLALSILAIIFIPQPLVVIALVALLNYLVIFQLLGLYSAFDYQPLTLLFPMKKGSKKAGLNKTIQLVMGMITVIEGGIGLVFISDKVLLLGLLAYTVALILL
ncbi:ABC transporter permease, partial [Collinsella aerofaciens]|nr:ABC transporter permease [Collinsella aerofaciens]